MPRPTINLRVELAPTNEHGLSLRNPVLVASGTFGYGTEYGRLVDVHRLGAIICKGTTVEERDGNLPPRTVETAAGMLNSIGLQNRGIAALLKDYAPKWARWSTPVLVNIAAESLHDYAELAYQLDTTAGIAGIEVNISCPNLDNGRVYFSSSPQSAAAATRAVVEATSLPVIVKLSPNVSDIAAIASAVEGAGADAISLINTVLGMAIDITTRQPTLGAKMGGLSGPAIKPIALRMVWQVSQAVSIPIIGIGGIASPADAIEFLMAGASAVQVGSATFTNPRAALDVLDGMTAWLHAEGIEDVHEIIGVALPAAIKDERLKIKGNKPMSTEQNKQLARRFFEAFNKADLNALDELVDANVVDHNPPAAGLAPGREGFKQSVVMLHSAFPDFHLTIEDMIAEGDKVVMRWTQRGTNKGEFMGMPPTGKQVTVTGIEIDRIANGKIAELWVQVDVLGMMQQLGVISTPGQLENRLST